MKRYIITNLVSILFLGVSFTSCNDWLTVDSMEEVMEDDAFSSREGYRSALIGAYMQAASQELWGRELTWGLMSALAWNYIPANTPFNYQNALNNTTFEDPLTRSVIAGIWNTAYNVIANCNNILVNIEKTDQSFFEYPWERDMIIAEARALRALVHFEMLRLFVPAPSTGYSGVAIPYVKSYPVVAPPFNTMKEVFEYVIDDLEFACDKLKYVDIEVMFRQSTMTSMGTQLFYGIQNLLPNGDRGNGYGFFSYRGFRMNYWGCLGMLARVHSYKRDNATAVEYIETLFTELGENGGREWGWNQYPSNPNDTDGKRLPEPLVCLWNTQNYTNYEKAIEEAGVSNPYRVNSLTELFTGNDIKEDYRYIRLYSAAIQRYNVWDRIKDAAQPASAIPNIEKFSGPALPVLELAEMYYILCEHYIEEGKLDDASEALKTVKNARNITSPVEAADATQLMEILVNDLTREYLTRGQTWHYLKKLNWKQMYNGTAVPWDVPDMWFVLPLPDSEINFM